MRKNININLFGTNYAIDEDACRLLEEYLDSIKQYFSHREGGEEIADDIEHRVAELLWEKKEQGVEVIDQMTIKTILKQIGKPEQMADESEPKEEANDTVQEPSTEESTSANEQTSAQEEPAAPHAEPAKRKLYRDPNNSVLGGVIGGITLYFGGNDPLLWRILFVVAALFMHIIPAVLLYVVLWALIPEAKTDEQRQEMTGGGTDTSVANGAADTNGSNDGCARGCFIVAALVAIVIIAFIFFFSSIYSSIFGMFEERISDPVGSGIFGMLFNVLRNLRLLVIVVIGAVLVALYFLLFRTSKHGKMIVLLILVGVVAVFGVTQCTGYIDPLNFVNWNRSVTHTVTNGNTTQRITHTEIHDWNGTTVRHDTVITSGPDDEIILDDCE